MDVIWHGRDDANIWVELTRLGWICLCLKSIALALRGKPVDPVIIRAVLTYTRH